MGNSNITNIIITAQDKASAALRSINDSFNVLENSAGKVTAVFTALTGIGASLSFAGVVGGITAMVKSTADAQDEMGKMAQKAGMSVEALSGLSYAANLAGADTEMLVRASKGLSSTIIDSGRAADQSKTLFGSLGISIKDSAGNFRETDQVLLDVAKTFEGMDNGANKSALAVKLFGKAGMELIPFLNQGKDGIQGLISEAEKLGVVMGAKNAATSEQFNDNLERMSVAITGLKYSIGNAALPMLGELVQQMTDATTTTGSLAGEINSLTSKSNLEEWAEKGAYAIAFVVDSGKGAIATFRGVGTTIGAMLSQTNAVLKGNFAGAKEIGRQWQEDLGNIFSYDQQRDKVSAWFDEYRRTVRVNGEKIVFDTADLAKTAQEEQDKLDAEKRQKNNEYHEFDEVALKKQDEIRKKYSEAENLRTMGEFAYKKQKIEEKYQAELLAIKGSSDASNLEIEIKRRMTDELISFNQEYNNKTIDGEGTVLEVARQSAVDRVGIEKGAASQVAAAWSQANAVKAAQTGGQIMNQGTPGEFVSSWDASGNYVGDLKGFATGGSFMVGGSGGTDSQRVSFMASPNERVTIETPEQQKSAGGNVSININVANGNPQSILSAIKQALRTDPGLFRTSMARAG